jgi:PPOX class probable F420-dependent enzyme
MGQLERFADQKTVVVTTYRRDGTPVDTPVHIAFDGGDVFMRTYETAMKWKRLRRNPEVVVSRADVGTRPAILGLLAGRRVKRVGEGVPARVILLEGSEDRRASAAIARKYPFLQGFLIPWIHRNVYHTRTLNLRVLARDDAARVTATG